MKYTRRNSSLVKKIGEVQSIVFLHCICEEVRVTGTFDLMKVYKKNSKHVLEKLDEYFIPKTNSSVACHKYPCARCLQKRFDLFVNANAKM